MEGDPYREKPKEESVMAYIITIWIVLLVVNGIAASKFESIAKMKGHEGYFWWCFWLGVIGWAMVIALPDRKNIVDQKEIVGSKEIENTDALPEL